jgi:hypothetical protein
MPINMRRYRWCLKRLRKALQGVYIVSTVGLGEVIIDTLLAPTVVYESRGLAEARGGTRCGMPHHAFFTLHSSIRAVRQWRAIRPGHCPIAPLN